MTKLLVADCRGFIRAVVEKAEELHVPVAIAVVNAEGHLLALERMDDAGWITPEIAWSKAFTAAAFRAMSPRFPDGMVIQQWFRERNPQMLVNASNFTGGRIVVGGGSAPVFVGDELVGAYGISGGTAQQDEVLGGYGRERVGWASRKAHDDTPDEVKQHVNEIYRSVGLADRAL